MPKEANERIQRVTKHKEKTNRNISPGQQCLESWISGKERQMEGEWLPPDLLVRLMMPAVRIRREISKPI